MDIEAKQICNRFAGDLLRWSYNPEKNTIVSPWSVISMLSLTADATAGQTHSELCQAIGREGSLQDRLDNEQCFHSANAFCFRSLEDVKHSFIAKHSKEMISTDELGKWITEHSGGMIEPIDPMETSAMLINVSRFEDVWMDGYKDIKARNFYSSDGMVQKATMMRSIETGYLETEDAEGFVKWYERGCYFLALLPKKRGKSAMREFLKNLDLNSVFDRGANADEVHASIPEFKNDYETELKDFCRERGVSNVFSEMADFSPMSSAPFRLDRIIHKAHIEVDRKGTKAAGFTAGICITGPPMEIRKRTVTLNRPFIYLIYQSRTGIPIFAGIVNKV